MACVFLGEELVVKALKTLGLSFGMPGGEDTLPGLTAEASSPGRAAEDCQRRLGHRLRIAIRDEKAGSAMSNHLRVASCSDGDDGDAASACFQEGLAYSFA